ncbi:hypothetical protein EJD97_024733 [Solanum chilense]|uniref:Uncharacterized protein n=1 Tax=Solanum chilense TaxID=4083 RepID=A0A6N2ASE7_SOLCI|nr:hypothetical protein EJD97_024733 [Solanum chilense]
MTKTAATRLGLRYSPSNAQLRTVNAPPTPVSGVAHRVSITLGEWQGVLPGMSRGDRSLPPTTYGHGGTCMIPLGKAPKTEGQVRLTAMQLKENPKKEKSTVVTTITSSKEENGAKKSLPQCLKNVPRGNNVVMPKRPPRRLPPRKEVDCETELEEMKKQLKELHEGIDRVNGLLSCIREDETRSPIK